MINMFILFNIILISVLIYTKKKNNEMLRKKEVDLNILRDKFLLYDHWLMIKNEKKSLASYFEDLGYYRIAIYGLGELANRLNEELKNSSIEVVYGIDRNTCNLTTNMKEIYSLYEMLPDVDAIVITPFLGYESIEKTLKEKVSCPLISIEEVVWSV